MLHHETVTKLNESSSTTYTADRVERVHIIGPPEAPPVAGTVPITSIMTRDVVCVRPTLPVETAVDLLVENRIGCLPVVDEDGCPVGMFTKRDLVEPFASRVTVRCTPIDEPVTVATVMLPLALSLEEDATVLDAAALMARQDMHHVPVVSPKGRLVGIVSSLDIVRWLASGPT